MKVPFVRFALAVCFAAATALAASSAAAESGKISKSLAKPLTAAQASMKANDFAGALTHIQEAQAVSGRTAFDDYTINQFLGNIYIGMKDYKNAEIAFKAMADSSAIPDADKASVMKGTIQLAVNNQDWPTVMAYGDKLQAAGQVSDDVLEPLAVAYYNAGATDKAYQLAKQAQDSFTKQGKTPPQSIMDIITRVQMKSDPQAAMRSEEQLAQTYGDPNVWSNVIESGFIKGTSELQALFLYRLRIATNAATSIDDYAIMADITTKAGYPAETAAILEHGLAQGVVKSGDKTSAALNTARGKLPGDKASLPGFDAQAKARKTGDYDVKLAETYYGYGRYAEAEQAASRAIAKGGVKDMAEAQMILGVSLAGEGKNAEAADAFSKVGGNASWQKIAHLWTIYAQRKYTTAAH